MPLFTFKQIKKICKPPSREKYEKYKSNIYGVIHIDLNGEYSINYENIKYPISPECYTCTKSNVIYQHGNGTLHRLKYIRDYSKKHEECNKLYWLPFTYGLKVKGNISIDRYTNKKYFIIKKICEDVDDECYQAIKFYKDNYKLINKNIQIERKHAFE